jgi:DNA-binding MarR family transcriptional regulator
VRWKAVRGMEKMGFVESGEGEERREKIVRA